MKRRWLIGGGVLVVAAVAAASLVWYVSRDDEAPLVATLQDMQHESTNQYAFPDWWTDGASTMRITGGGDALRVDEPLAQYDYTGHDDLFTELAAADGTEPAAVAALPGDPAAGWVAIAFPPEEKGGDDASSTQRPLTWTGRVPARDSPPAQAVELPVALHNVTSSADIKAASAVVARFDDTEMAIALTSQADSFSLQICSIGDCQWAERTMPEGLAIASLASTGDGVVAVTADDDAIWYADDASLTWKKIGSAPSGMRLQTMRDGEGQVAIVWKSRDDGAVSLAVQTVSDGEVHNAVERIPVEGELDRLYAVVEYDGRWYLGGARPSAARISIAYDVKEAVLWQQGDKSWVAVDDELLRNQPDQEIEALYIDHDGHLRAISNSPVQRGTMLWMFSRAER